MWIAKIIVKILQIQTSVRNSVSNYSTSQIYSDFQQVVGDPCRAWLSINKPSLTHQTKFGL